jgi:hypothetical protein
MMDSTQKKDIYFVIKPLCYVSQVLGMVGFKIGSANKCLSRERYFVPEYILPIFIIINLCVYLYFNVLYATNFSAFEITPEIRVIFTFNKIVICLTSVVTLLLNITLDKHCIPQTLSYIHDADLKLFKWDCREKIFKQARSSSIVQLTVATTITALENILPNILFPPNAPTDIIHSISHILCAAINRMMILQYTSLVLSLKQRYKYMNYLLSEPLMETEFMKAKHSNEDGSICRSCNPILLHTALKLNFNHSIYIINTIHDLRLIYSQLHDTLLLVNKRYGIPILLYTISTLTYSIPMIYLEIVSVRNIIYDYRDPKQYLQGMILLGLYIPHLIFFLWLITCCHKTSNEASETLIDVNKLLVYPNTGHRVSSELHSFCSLLRDARVEFKVCGLFALNLRLLCWSFSIVFTYVLVLVQLNWK